MIVYWIREKDHTDIYSEGYVGITKKPLEERVREHKKNKRTSVVSYKLRNKECVFSVVHSVDSLEEALKLEAYYRPTKAIGWNLQKGGELGVESDWYNSGINKQKHSMKTSEGTLRGIATKDTTEARRQRALRCHIEKSESYKDIVKGERNPRAILTEKQVRQIKYEMFTQGLSNKEIAELFGVKPYLISFIRTGKNWSHV